MAFILTRPTSGAGGIVNECLPFYRSDGALDTITIASNLLPFYRSDGVLDTITIVSNLLPFYRSDDTFDPILMEKCAPGCSNITMWGSISGVLLNQTDLQTALNGKSALVHTHVMTDITDSTWISDIAGQSIKSLSDVLTSMAPADGDLLSWNNTAGYWENIPTSSFVITDHTLLTNIGVNTHAQIDTHISSTSNPHSVTKTQVGLGNVDNTADVDKPISTATQTGLDTKVSKSGDTMTGSLTVANLANSINSGDYPIQMLSNITSTGAARGLVLDTVNNLNTDGDKIFSVNTNGNERFYVGRENGVWGTKIHNHLAVGKSTLTIPQFSLLKIDDSVTFSSFGQQGDGIDLDIEMNIGTVFAKAAAFSGKAVITGSGALPFISGMVFEVDQQGTGSWGGAPGSWGLSPSVVAARWSSQPGAANFGNWASVFTSFPPALASGGGVRGGDGTYIGFEAGSGQGSAPNLYGIYVWGQTTSGIATGIHVKKSLGTVNSRGIVLAGDGIGADIVFGATQDAQIYYDGTDLIIKADAVGTGITKFTSKIQTADVIKDRQLNISAAIKPVVNFMRDGFVGLFAVALADDSTDENRNINFHLPGDWKLGTDINIHIHLINVVTQTGTNSVVTELTYLPVGDGENALGAGTTLSGTYTLANNAAAGTMHDGSIFILPGSALAAGDVVGLRVLRKGTSSADTAVGDIGYDGMHITYVSNILGK